MARNDRDCESSMDEVLSEVSDMENLDLNVTQNRFAVLNSSRLTQDGGHARADGASHEVHEIILCELHPKNTVLILQSLKYMNLQVNGEQERYEMKNHQM